MNTAPIISKVWSFCITLRDDGVGYGDHFSQPEKLRLRAGESTLRQKKLDELY